MEMGAHIGTVNKFQLNPAPKNEIRVVDIHGVSVNSEKIFRASFDPNGMPTQRSAVSAASHCIRQASNTGNAPKVRRNAVGIGPSR